MSQLDGRRLDGGDLFPSMTLELADGGTLVLPPAADGPHVVLLAYRGHACGVCKQHLADYEAARAQLAAEGVSIAAISADTLEDAQATVREKGLRFPVAWGADPRAFAAATGAFFHEKQNLLQSSCFLVRPGGKLGVAVYSSGAFGHLTPQDVLGLMPYLRPKAAAKG